MNPHLLALLTDSAWAKNFQDDEAAKLEHELTTITAERDQLRAEVERLNGEATAKDEVHAAVGRLTTFMSEEVGGLAGFRSTDSAIEYMRQLRARVSELEAHLDTEELASLEQDKARLDWLIEHHNPWQQAVRPAYGKKAVRAAIDAAMKGTP
jgi:hypothetical protein